MAYLISQSTIQSIKSPNILHQNDIQHMGMHSLYNLVCNRPWFAPYNSQVLFYLLSSIFDSIWEVIIPISCRWCRSAAKGHGGFIWNEDHWPMPKYYYLLCSYSGDWKVITFLCMLMQWFVSCCSILEWYDIFSSNSYQKGWPRIWPQALFWSKRGLCCSEPCNVSVPHRWSNISFTSLVLENLNVHQESWIAYMIRPVGAMTLAY